MRGEGRGDGIEREMVYEVLLYHSSGPRTLFYQMVKSSETHLIKLQYSLSDSKTLFIRLQTFLIRLQGLEHSLSGSRTLLGRLHSFNRDILTIRLTLYGIVSPYMAKDIEYHVH